jgi:hypothetical protein
MGVLRKLWWGQYSLPMAFWGFYVFGWLAILILFFIILIASYSFHSGTVGFILGIIVLNCYWLMAIVGVWRSANAASKVSPIWPLAAKAVICLSVIRAVWWLMNGGAHTLMQRMTAPMDF